MDRTLNLLSEYCVSLSYKEFDQGLVHAAKRRIIDTLGCTMGSYNMGPPKIARAHALEVTSAPGATVLGTSHKSSPELAAFANGVMSRYLDFNDMSVSARTGHPSDNIMAVLAAAEYAGADMQTTIAGVVLAYEIMDRVGAACVELRKNGWDQGAYIVLGSAAGAGKVLGLNKEQTANALALAVVPNAAMGQTRVGELSMWKGCASANAGRNGVFAAMLARRGLTGPEEAIEGKAGFKKQLGTSMQLTAFGGKEAPFTITESRFKNFPCDFEAQCCLNPAVELHQDIKGKVEEIENIDVETYSHAVEISAGSPDKWNPKTRETADHSLPYVVSVALTRGTVWLDDFVEERIRDPKIHALMQKIHVHATDGCDKIWPDAYPFYITLTTKSGQKFYREVRYAKGHPKNPLSDQEMEAKFRRLAEPVMGQAQVTRALAQLWKLESMKGIKELVDLFVLASSAR